MDSVWNRNVPVLHEGDKEDVVDLIDHLKCKGSSHICPWLDCNICADFFPKVVEPNGSIVCPCFSGKYTTHHLINVLTKILREQP